MSAYDYALAFSSMEIYTTWVELTYRYDYAHLIVEELLKTQE